ncbi:MAG: hypothetical protein U1G07_24005 [Verrucomicrobiota bacterium]
MNAEPQRIREGRALLACVLLVLIVIEGSAATFPLTWRWSNPLPHGNNIIDIAVRDQLWIQVAERGTIYTSTDHVTWTPQESHTRRALRAVTFFNDIILVAGESGTILSGTSPGQLQLIDLGTADWLEGVAASTQIAVAVGDTAAIYTSLNGVVWQRHAVPFSDWLRSVAFGNGTFVAVGERGFIATSTDGVHWQTQPRVGAEDLNRVQWFAGEFWVVGNGGSVWQSTAGRNWSKANTGAVGALGAFAALNATRLVAGDSEVRFRAGRSTWRNELAGSNISPPPVWTYLSAIALTNSYLLCGRTGMMVEGLVSPDNATGWLTLYDSPRSWLWDVKRFPSLYLAVGDQATLMSSVDGANWQLELPPDSATNSIFLGIGGRTNLAVAVGSAGTIISSLEGKQTVVSTNSSGNAVTNEISTLGIFWDAVLPRPTTNDLQGVTVWGDRLVVSGGQGTILTSTDAQHWTRQTTPTTALLSCLEVFADGVIAVGQDGVILTSPDTSNWQMRTSGTANWIYRVRNLGGQLVAVGQNGMILTSTDGHNWTARNSGTTQWLYDVQWVGQTYFAVGAQGVVLSSSDAITWSDEGTITGKSLFGASTYAGMLVLVGTEGVILRSQVETLNTPVNFVQFPHGAQETLFLFAGQAGQKFTLDRSTNLNLWLTGPVLELNDSGSLLHSDSGANATQQQFFRTTAKP